jgi:hypothetical protein
MFSILSHKGNANESNIVIPSQTSQNGYHQEKKGYFIHYWWEYKLM